MIIQNKKKGKKRMKTRNYLINFSILFLFFFHGINLADIQKKWSIRYTNRSNPKISQKLTIKTPAHPGRKSSPSYVYSQNLKYRQVFKKKDFFLPERRQDPGFSYLKNPKLGQRLKNKLSSLQDKEMPVKIWVYFTDKGITSRTSLRKNLSEVRQRMKERCLWRRFKVRREKNIVDDADIPLFLPYTKKVRTMVKRVRTISRWLNALSAEADISEILGLSKLEFVRKIDHVASFRRNESPLPLTTGLNRKKQNNPGLDYGLSFPQLEQINVPSLHQLGFSGRGVLVCMLDTGFRKSHEAFQGARIISEWDFVNGDNDVEQDLSDPTDYSDSHGTATWSLLGGYKHGELIGVAYEADFLLAKTETTIFEQPIEEDYWVAGIEWAEALGAEVVSSSLGYTDWYTFEDMNGETAVTTIAADRAVSLGVVVVTAVGNDRNNSWGHIIAPSDGFDVIAVGAVDASGQIASFSSPGPTSDGRTKPEVCALGIDNWIADQSSGSDSYTTGDGTSFATPLVAGVAALLLEIHRDWTPAQVRSALLSTSSQSQNPDNDFGWGIVNAVLAANLDLALPKLQAFTIDDDTSGESYGNGNGKAEIGETLELSISLKNEGYSTASSLEGSLSSTHPDVKIITSTVTFPLLLPLMSQSSDNPFVIKIPDFYLGHHVIFRLQVEGPDSLTLYETLRISVSR